MEHSFFARHSYWLFIAMFLTMPLYARGLSLIPTTTFIIALGFFLIKPKFFWHQLIESRYLLVFLIFFIPGLISLLDSLEPGKTIQTLWRLLRYSAFALLAIFMICNPKSYQKFSFLMFWLLILICVDAMCQWLFGYNIYGHNPAKIRVQGVFRDTLHHLSYFIATLSPLIFFYLQQKIASKNYFYYCLAPLIIVMLILTVLVGGARAGFVSLGVSFLLFIIYAFKQGWIKHKLRFAGFLILLLSISGGIAFQSEVIQKRFQQTTTVQKDESFLYRFTSKRPNIWHVVVKEVPNYWVNGVGLRGFDALYQSYPKEYKIFSSVNHPHLHILEVLIETGVIGLLPYLFLCFYLLYLIYTAREGNAWLMVAFLAIMPINSHAGLFEGEWLPIVWLSLAIGIISTYKNKKISIYSQRKKTI